MRCRRARSPRSSACPPVARVPQAPKGLLGLANLRGHGPAGRQPARPGCGSRRDRPRPRPGRSCLDGAAPVALAVDAVEALVTRRADQIETRQAELAARPGERLKGAFRRPTARSAIAKILDIEAADRRALSCSSGRAPRRAPAGTAAGRQGDDGETAGDDRQMLVSFEVAGQEYALALDVRAGNPRRARRRWRRCRPARRSSWA